MSKRNAKLLLDDLLEAIEKIQTYTNELQFDDFQNDTKTIDAVIRNIEIIGEATAHFPTEFIQKHPDIQWHKIISTRNRIIHGYFDVSLKLVWQIIENELPTLKTKIQTLLK